MDFRANDLDVLELLRRDALLAALNEVAKIGSPLEYRPMKARDVERRSLAEFVCETLLKIRYWATRGIHAKHGISLARAAVTTASELGNRRIVSMPRSSSQLETRAAVLGSYRETAQLACRWNAADGSVKKHARPLSA